MSVREISSALRPREAFAALGRLRRARGEPAAPPPGWAFLESALPIEGLGRWSFLGLAPFLVFTAERDEIALDWREGAGNGAEGAGRIERFRADPFEVLGELLARFRATPADGPGEAGGEPPFRAGAIGYLGYDLRTRVERLPAEARRDQRFPDLHLAFFDAVLAHDGASGRWVASAVELDAPGLAGRPPAEARLREAERLLRSLEAERDREAPRAEAAPAPPSSARRAPGGLSSLPPGVRSNFTRADYERAVRRVVEYIRAGDIFQANLSQRFEAAWRGPPEEFYLRLRQATPAPFAAYLDLGSGRAVASASPERFLRVRGRAVETRPIKGTRRRGASAAEDRALAAELLASAKDAAELAMIVDVERNDLGRVCEYGSVEVTERVRLEAHPTVFHLVATVRGRLREGLSAAALLRATFPGGSITGAPKIRAMEILDALEPTARSVYTGAIGCLDLSGDLDLNVAIRTALLDEGRAAYQAGGGLVADSDPAAEYEETLAKAAAFADVVAPPGAPE